jgi:hypothetical protein
MQAKQLERKKEQLGQLPALRTYWVLTQFVQVEALEQVTQLGMRLEQLLHMLEETV